MNRRMLRVGIPLLLSAVALLFVLNMAPSIQLAATVASDDVQSAFAAADRQHGIAPTVAHIAPPAVATSDIFGGLAGLLAIGAGLIAAAALYFLPSIVARNRRNGSAIFLLNLLLGWTFLGWVAALVWAATSDQASSSSTNTTSSPAAMP